MLAKNYTPLSVTESEPSPFSKLNIYLFIVALITAIVLIVLILALIQKESQQNSVIIPTSAPLPTQSTIPTPTPFPLQNTPEPSIATNSGE